MADEGAAKKRPVKIVVSDKQRRETKQFSCDWFSLRKSMKYFETVLDKVPESSTAPLTLNVNCDLVIFAWLMDYVNNFNPQLKVSNVVSIILSSHFLKMEELFKHSLAFFRRHLAEVLATDVNMSCVPPDVVAELEGMLTLGDLAAACLELQASDQDKCPNRAFLSQLIKNALLAVMPQRIPALRFCQFCGILFDAVKQQQTASRIINSAVVCPTLSQGRIGPRGELMKSHDGAVLFTEQPPSSAVECEAWCWKFIGTTVVATCRRCSSTVPLLSIKTHCCRGPSLGSMPRDFMPDDDVRTRNDQGEVVEEKVLIRFFFDYALPPIEPFRGEITSVEGTGDDGAVPGSRVMWEGPMISSVIINGSGAVNQDMIRFHETKMFEVLQQLVDSLAPGAGGGGAIGSKRGVAGGRAQTALTSGGLGRNSSLRSTTSSAALSTNSSFGSVRSLASLKKKPLFK